MPADYFDTTYQGAYRSGLSLGDGLQSAAKNVGGVIAERNKQKQAYQTLKAAGMISEKVTPPSDDELKKGLEEFAKSSGISQVNWMESDDPEETRNSLEGTYKALGIPLPKGKTTIDYNLAPGTKYKVNDNLVMEGQKKEKSMMDQIAEYKMAQNMLGEAGLAPDGMEVVGYDQRGKPMIRKVKDTTALTPGERTLKIKNLKELKSTVETNKVQREKIEEARKALEKLPSGLVGRAQMGMTKQFDPDNPIMGEWQKVKQVLLDDTLLNTARTKGAISDQEMLLFKEAAANDNLMSKPKVKVVFDKLVNFINADEKAKVEAYEESFGNSEGNSNISRETSDDDPLGLRD